ncbi:MAG: protein kinase domain-containing protein [Planctomycetota bacterium]
MDKPTDEWNGQDRELPQRIGRYRVESVLGQGGFGTVYLARDDQLDRYVAIKVPHPERVESPEDVETYLAEARLVAGLDHPGIVPVYDVGRTEEGLCYVVSKYIEGSNLWQRTTRSRPTHTESAQWVAAVAEALHHAHLHGVIHRDVKPGNILIDPSGKPYVADFGLALKEEDVGEHVGFVGTPEYMSPEQARGEGHRLDGRSDIFSLGIVLYELLTGRCPFGGKSKRELRRQIITLDVRPPRQMDDRIPKELERICLRALSKRMSDRYTTALDLAEDLRHYLAAAEQADSAPADSNRVTRESQTTPLAGAPTPVITPTSAKPSEEPPVRVVPKGLRPFDEQDADFFVDLLPGPRDRHKLPDSIRFWKRRIEETDPDKTFPVGLIYGASGCGKSSFVRAGLTPRLAEHVLTVYVECTAKRTEARLLKELGKVCPFLPENSGLSESMAAVRRGRGLAAGKKILIVLDQFEQWLHASRTEADQDLVESLRHCDGGRVQCLVMVRDDFWMAVTQFFQALEIPLVERQNSAAVDVFDLRHAKDVLTAFGRAFGALPEGPKELAREQKSFVEQAAAGLAREGKVICVRLALFAEMMRSKPWTPPGLKAVGGAEGLGVRFLEETFGATTAPPEHRFHQRAARSALRALLPEHEGDIRANIRSYEELLEASGYARRPEYFGDLLRLLDAELRLVTPTEPERAVVEGQPPSQAAPETKYYQLTHDYLVSSVREWLNQKQKETRRGRAELLLAEQSALWNAKPENRYLPSMWEWLKIRLLTVKKSWTEPQRRMLRKVGRRHLARAVLAAVLLASLAWAGYWAHGQFNAEALVQRLVVAETEEVPEIIKELPRYRRWADEILEGTVDRHGETSKEGLHAMLALLPVHPEYRDRLYEQLYHVARDRFLVVRNALANHKADLVGPLWSTFEDRDQDDHKRFRAACCLADYAPGDPRWQEVSGEVARQLVTVSADAPEWWADLLRPIKDKLLLPLGEIFRDTGRRKTERFLAAVVLQDYASDEPRLLTDLLCDADADQFRELLPALEAHGSRATALLESELARTIALEWDDPSADPKWEVPDPSIVRKIDAGQGLMAERFAFCQTMRLDDFIAVAEALRKSGYRPTSLRPYSSNDTTRAAAVWARDGRQWQLVPGATAEEIRALNLEWSKAGYRPMDVAGYRSTDAGRAIDQYAVLWAVSENDDEAAMFVGLSADESAKRREHLQRSGYRAAHWSDFVAGDDAKRYSAVWSKSQSETIDHVIISSIEAPALEPAEHLVRCRELAELGYRPASISGDVGADKPLSVWYRPHALDEEAERIAERIAKRKANAAVALLRMGRVETVLPVLEQSRSPDVRSHVIHRLGPMGVASRSIGERLNGELHPSVERALILSLGEFPNDQLPPEWKAPWIDRLLVTYENNPDPGIHGAAEWLLRRWKQEASLEEIDEKLATGKVEGRRHWYLTGQRHTMVVVTAAAEFYAGQLEGTKRPGVGHRLFWKRIERSFAIASKETTTEQFQQFLKENPEIDNPYKQPERPGPNGPGVWVSWLDAAAYCNWLSLKEGVLRDQWCYEPYESKDSQKGLKPAADCLERTGYRFPTEEEWEYACRAGSMTSRYYGQSEELLRNYAWFVTNSLGETWPVATLKPNDLGLFDTHGNAWELCQDLYQTPAAAMAARPAKESESVEATVREEQECALRGGSANDSPRGIRSASRMLRVPTGRGPNVGFRVARTLP